ncbi:MAG: hypothetical protein J7K72_03780 [Candidatus Aenigmarchaeota archaeon]|nr:hypothetical protein [Candidatus Aenigmarchaeota archaeon]
MLLWLASKLFALIIIGIGVFLVFFFPGTAKHQDYGYVQFGLSGITVGLILLIVGIFILFAP